MAGSRGLLALIAILAGLAAGVLGYGWWHAASHATMHVTLQDTSVTRGFASIKGAQVAFLDEVGGLLARGKTDEKAGVLWVSHPTAGYCGPDLPQPAFIECFRRHAPWLLSWVREARYISIATPRCRIERAPIYFSESRDSMWTWWIPLPHVGGTPYTHFIALVRVDGQTCAVTPHRG